MRVLITGAGGFIGSHLASELAAKGVLLAFIARSSTPFLKRFEKSKVFIGDIRDQKFVRDVVRNTSPDVVYHLAAQSSPSRSWQDPKGTYDVNVNGTLSLLEALKNSHQNPLMISVCSSAEYGGKKGLLLESDPLEPSSPYGISKLAQDHFTRMYAELYGLKTVRCRPFFLIGPGKEGDVCSSFAKQIVAAEIFGKRIVKVGNLERVRDLLDVRDGVEALQVVAKKGKVGDVYNICSGTGVSLRKVLSEFGKLTNSCYAVKSDPELMRFVDESSVIGNPDKIIRLGWTPRFNLTLTLKDILDYWRDVYRVERITRAASRKSATTKSGG
jgi:nucleoside-diphosphate-sugar epimerase